MKNHLAGYVVDIVALIAVTILGALKVLPEAAISSMFTVILVGRAAVRDRAEPPAGGAVNTSGFLLAVASVGTALAGKRA